MVFFFFFQAEDGIRDLTVTGVQTCALPIWRLPPRRGRLMRLLLPQFTGRIGRKNRSAERKTGSRLPGIGELEPTTDKRPKRHLPTGSTTVAVGVLSVAAGVLISPTLAVIGVILAVIVLVIEAAGTRQVQERLPWVRH